MQYHPIRTTLGRGGIYTPNLITSFQKCPSRPHKGLEITIGVFGNFPRLDSLTWILLLGSRVSCPSGTFGGSLGQASYGVAFMICHFWVVVHARRFLSWSLCAWLRAIAGTFGLRSAGRPSVATFVIFADLRWTFAVPEATRRSRHHLRRWVSASSPMLRQFGGPSAHLRVIPPSRGGRSPTGSTLEQVTDLRLARG